MERQEIKIGSPAVVGSRCLGLSCLKHSWNVSPGLFFFLAVLLLSVSGWSTCINSNYSKTVSLPTCYPYTSSGWYEAYDACGGAPSACPGTIPTDNGGYYVFSGQASCSVNQTNGCSYSVGNCIYNKICSKCEADSIVCVGAGYSWDSQNCQCNSCSCDDLQSQCESINGTFEGNCANADPNGGQCCVGTCFLCNTEASKNQQELAKRVCCSVGMVPPKLSDYCFDNPPSGKCGMNYSNVSNEFDSQWKCRELDENSSTEMVSWYREACLTSSSSAAVSSNSGESSSSGDGSSSSGSPYPEDCLECPWLDSILDTLTAQKWIVQDIQTCVLNPSLCGSVEGDQPQVDTSLLPYIRPFMDSSVQLSREQIEILSHLDTNLKKILDTLSKIPKSDTAVMMAINGASSAIDGKLSIVNQSIVNMNDSNKKWLRRIADSLRVINDTNKKYLNNVAEKIGISTDSLVKHIDSVKNRIPSDILDSILKYQKLSSESSDSIAVNVDLSSIDSLIDSTISYWNKSLRADSLRGERMNDSLGAIHDAIEGISYTMYQLLGYGDTASRTLRNDIEGIENAINEYRDSALKYYASFGDSMGALNGSLGVLIGQFTPGTVDTGNVGYANTWAIEGERMSDSIARAIGWTGGMDTVNVDSVFKRASWNSSGVDSVNNFVNDTLSGILDSLHLQLKHENDSLKNSLSDSLTVWADSMIKVSPFASFDSLIYSTIGAKIPNSDECPEDCQSWTLSLPRFGLVNYTVDFGLCLGRVPLGGLNVLGFLKLVVRLVIVWTCISIVMWTFSHRKM